MIISFSKNNSSLNVPCVITLNGKTNIAQMSSIFSDAKKLFKEETVTIFSSLKLINIKLTSYLKELFTFDL